MSRQYDAWVQAQLEPDQEMHTGRRVKHMEYPDFDIQKYYDLNRRHIEMQLNDWYRVDDEHLRKHGII